MKATLLNILLFIVFSAHAQEPQLFWGRSSGKSSVSPEQRVLAIQTETYEGSYTILDWEMTIDQQTKKGKGSYLSEEISPWIHEFRKDSLRITIRANYEHQPTKSLSTIQNTFIFTNSIYTSDLTKPYSGFILIDKNKTNYDALFNAANPKSLMGMILQNPLSSPAFMSDATLHTILSKNPGTSFLKSTGFQSDVPLVSTKLDARGRIVDSLASTEVGYSFIYPMPEEYAYDLTDISRFILILDTVENSQTKKKEVGISRIGLAKKYPHSDKYNIVLTFSFREFASMEHFRLLLEADSAMTQKLTGKNSYYRGEFKEKCLHTTLESFISEERNHLYFPYFSNPPGSGREREFLLTSHLDQQVSKLSLDNQFFYTPGGAYHFENTHSILGPESDIPLSNTDGNDSIFISDDGVMVFVYPARDTIITWIETDSIHVFVQYELESNQQLIPAFQPKTIYFVKQAGALKIPFLAFYLEDNSDRDPNYFKMGLADLVYEGHFAKEIAVSDMECMRLIAQIFVKKPRILRPGNKKDTARLFSEFNLEKKGNLLNIQVK